MALQTFAERVQAFIEAWRAVPECHNSRSTMKDLHLAFFWPEFQPSEPHLLVRIALTRKSGKAANELPVLMFVMVEQAPGAFRLRCVTNDDLISDLTMVKAIV